MSAKRTAVESATLMQLLVELFTTKLPQLLAEGMEGQHALFINDGNGDGWRMDALGERDELFELVGFDDGDEFAMVEITGRPGLLELGPGGVLVDFGMTPEEWAGFISRMMTGRPPELLRKQEMGRTRKSRVA
jgi:hypothetical protein